MPDYLLVFFVLSYLFVHFVRVAAQHKSPAIPTLAPVFGALPSAAAAFTIQFGMGWSGTQQPIVTGETIPTLVGMEILNPKL